MAEVRQRLFHWLHQGQEVAITVVLDDADVDTIAGETYRRVLQFEIDGNLMRGGAFQYHSGPPLQRGVGGISVEIPDTLLRTIPVLQRITEKDLAWDFTPTHVDAQPGSVSNPSLLTSGGATSATNTITSNTSAAFTPTANSLLVAGWSSRMTAAPSAHTQSFTNTHAGSGAWAQVGVNAGASDALRHDQARCQMGANPGAAQSPQPTAPLANA